jgi:hypothetical protein
VLQPGSTVIKSDRRHAGRRSTSEENEYDTMKDHDHYEGRSEKNEPTSEAPRVDLPGPGPCLFYQTGRSIGEHPSPSIVPGHSSISFYRKSWFGLRFPLLAVCLTVACRVSALASFPSHSHRNPALSQWDDRSESFGGVSLKNQGECIR